MSNFFGFDNELIFLAGRFSLTVFFQVNNWSRGVCPKRQMSCIGKFRRNLVTMRETLYFYLFEKLVFLLDVALLAISDNLTPEALFWAHNTLMLLQFIGRMGFYSLIIHAPDSKMNSVLPATAAESKFYVLTSKFLEPRRPSLYPPKSSHHQYEGEITVASCSRKCNSSSKYLVLGEPGPSDLSTSLPSIHC